jgi:hypothetical protein
VVVVGEEGVLEGRQQGHRRGAYLNRLASARAAMRQVPGAVRRT